MLWKNRKWRIIGSLGASLISLSLLFPSLFFPEAWGCIHGGKSTWYQSNSKLPWMIKLCFHSYRMFDNTEGRESESCCIFLFDQLIWFINRSSYHHSNTFFHSFLDWLTCVFNQSSQKSVDSDPCWVSASPLTIVGSICTIFLSLTYSCPKLEHPMNKTNNNAYLVVHNQWTKVNTLIIILLISFAQFTLS